MLETRNVFDQLKLSLNIILQLLDDLESVITFAQLETFHCSILKIDKIKSISHKDHGINYLIFSVSKKISTLKFIIQV